MRVIKIDEKRIRVFVKNNKWSEKEDSFTYEMFDGKIYQNGFDTDYKSSKERIESWETIEKETEIERIKIDEAKKTVKKPAAYKMSEADFNAMSRGFDCAEDII